MKKLILMIILLSSIGQVSFAQNGADYIKKCEEFMVPVPPAWGTLKTATTNGWVKKGRLPKGRVIISPQFEPVEMWEYKTDKGLCIALARYEDDATAIARGATAGPNGKLPKIIHEVGIICQSAETHKACFWAAHERKKGKHIKGANLDGLKPIDMLDGAHPLTSPVCTECHRGSNVFIWRPGTKLLQDDDTELAYEPDTGHLADRYMPVAKERLSEDKQHLGPNGKPRTIWQNEGSLKLKDEQCGSCHAFADVTKSWCEDVLKPALGKGKSFTLGGKTFGPPPRTMPVLEGNETKLDERPNWKELYKDDLKLLTRKCKEVGVDLKI